MTTLALNSTNPGAAGVSTQNTSNAQTLISSNGLFSGLPTAGISGTPTAYTSDQGLRVWNGTAWMAIGTIPLLTKIRAGIAAAMVGNPVESLPWSTVQVMQGTTAARANATAYTKGFVCTNAAGTHMFVCQTAGTSAGAEPGAMTTALVTTAPYNMGAIVDNTVTWYWMGPTRVTAAQAGAPTISVGSLPAQVSKAWLVAPTVAGTQANSYFRITGGVGSITGQSNPNATFVIGEAQPTVTAMLGTANGFGNYCNAMDFVTDATVFGIDMTGFGSLNIGDQMNIEIDGRRFTDGTPMSLASAANGAGYMIVDFRATGVRKNRRIRLSTFRVSATNAPSFTQIFTTPQDTIQAYTNPNRWSCAFVGDSLIVGSASGPVNPRLDRASVFADLVGCDTISNLGVGGTGFIATASGTQLNYIQRLSSLITLKPNVVYIGGAFNDGASGAAAITAAALAYYQAVRAALPNAMIIQAGTFGGLLLSSSTGIDAALLAAVNQFGDSNTFFIPVSTDSPPWLTGTNAIQGTPTGTGNSEIYIGPTDTVHPSAYCISSYLAQQDARAFKNLINSL